MIADGKVGILAQNSLASKTDPVGIIKGSEYALSERASIHSRLITLRRYNRRRAVQNAVSLIATLLDVILQRRRIQRLQ